MRTGLTVSALVGRSLSPTFFARTRPRTRCASSGSRVRWTIPLERLFRCASRSSVATNFHLLVKYGGYSYSFRVYSIIVQYCYLANDSGCESRIGLERWDSRLPVILVFCTTVTLEAESLVVNLYSLFSLPDGYLIRNYLMSTSFIFCNCAIVATSVSYLLLNLFVTRV